MIDLFFKKRLLILGSLRNEGDRSEESSGSSSDDSQFEEGESETIERGANSHEIKTK